VGATNQPEILALDAKGEQSMILRLFALLMVSIIVIGGSAFVRPTQSASSEPCAQDHAAWLTHVLEKMETIKPGMSREGLLKVFRAEAGLSTGLRRTFVSRDCPYFKVDVEFKAVARPNRDSVAFVTSVEDSRDIIVKVSKPYVQFAITD
jgi:hypothetical protein